MTARQSRSDVPAPPPSGRLDPALVRLALVLMLGGLAAGLDTTIVNVALDVLGRHFGASVATIQWVGTGYLLALTMVVPLTAWSVRRCGARRMWLASLALFLGGSMLCGAAWSVGSLIAFRVLQGAGGGMLLPLIRTILAGAAGRERMGRAMVLVAVPGSLTPVLGPVLGGLVVAELGWRWAFYLNAPLCLLGLALALRVLPADEPARTGSRLDAWGLVLLSLGLAAIVLGLSEAGNRGSVTSAAAAALVTGVALVTAYALRALRTAVTPIIDVRLFRVRSFAASSGLLFLLGGSLFGGLFLLPLYYQQARGAGVLHAGLLLAPLGLGMSLAMSRAGRIVDRTGAVRALALTGMGLAAAGFAPFAFAGRQASQWLLGPAVFVTGVGIGTVMLAALTATYHGLSPARTAAATAANRIVQQVGGTLGVAVLAVVVQHGAGHPPATAFGHAFGWVLALTVLATVPAMLLPGRRPAAAVPANGGPGERRATEGAGAVTGTAHR